MLLKGNRRPAQAGNPPKSENEENENEEEYNYQNVHQLQKDINEEKKQNRLNSMYFESLNDNGKPGLKNSFEDQSMDFQDVLFTEEFEENRNLPFKSHRHKNPFDYNAQRNADNRTLPCSPFNLMTEKNMNHLDGKKDSKFQKNKNSSDLIDKKHSIPEMDANLPTEANNPTAARENSKSSKIRGIFRANTRILK